MQSESLEETYPAETHDIWKVCITDPDGQDFTHAVVIDRSVDEHHTLITGMRDIRAGFDMQLYYIARKHFPDDYLTKLREITKDF